MKKLYFLLLLFSGTVSAQIVNIPDVNFKAKLLSASPTLHIASNVNPNSTASPNVYTAVDTNGNGEIEVSEAEAIVYLTVSGSPMSSNTISSLEGIQYFTNLKWLYCSNNTLETLDISNNFALLSLSCTNNLLTSIIFDNPNLASLSCGSNLLSTLNLQGCPGLLTLGCGANNLTTIDFASNPLLKSVGIANNPLTSIDVNNLQNLEGLAINYTNITSINVSNKPNLLSVNLGYNAFLTNVELVNLPHCYKVNIQNCNISSIDLSTVAYMPYINSGNVLEPSVYKISLNNNANLTHVNFKNGFNNPNIDFFSSALNNQQQYLCLDEGDVFSFIDFNSGSLMSTYCNFNPGGLYNTITGIMTIDDNNNGCDALDDIQSNIRVNINDGTNTGASFTNSIGNYTFYTQTGNFTVTPAVENPTWFAFSPPTTTVSFANANNNVVTRNFCITANGIHPDVEVIVAPVLPARPGFDAVYKLVYKNKGNQTLSGNVTFAYDDNVLDYVSTTEVLTAQSAGLLTWSYANLLPFENRSFYVTLHVNAPTDTPAVNIGDVLHFTTVVNPIAGDEFPADNTFQYNQTVVGSFDPNDITCLEGAVIPPSEIGNYLHYIINFENTGTAEAENIVVKEVIDTTKYDLSSLQVLNSSHLVNAKLTNNIAEFIFQNINLDSGGHGNILLKIKSKNTLVQGNMVSKKANIYFDYNFPVATNNADTVFQSLNTPDFPKDVTISVYPNPVKNTVTITSQFAVKSIELYDVQGRLLQKQLTNESRAALDMSAQIKGVYFIKIITEKGMKVEKVVKE
ncbi:T9SS type A sorting domain-containing protein [Flavobacterium silvisoli]|uniref:T9SS type A sorting domain-containing protein n=1 Tax=Flavobacterium silvisoli TaxID=2529433 RepID=A0A4Q9YSF4_9FLAO|nr:T9SS type A sorting domain-containing protein [Flavobacterium silvisoli]TBX66337.1 T9SS type A sorting domain-containing protein [Flavobacterium silvisoli]